MGTVASKCGCVDRVINHPLILWGWMERVARLTCAAEEDGSDDGAGGDGGGSRCEGNIGPWGM